MYSRRTTQTGFSAYATPPDQNQARTAPRGLGGKPPLNNRSRSTDHQPLLKSLTNQRTIHGGGGGGARSSSADRMIKLTTPRHQPQMVTPSSRGSLIPRPSSLGGGQRTSQFYGRPSQVDQQRGSLMVVDQKQVQDYSHQVECAKKIVETLHFMDPENKNLYNEELFLDSKKITIDLFKQVFVKLISIWSPNYGLPDKTQQTLEGEVLRIMAALGYPYRIDKTQLKTISNLRVWPYMLSMLAWLAHVTYYALTVNVEMQMFAPNEVDLQAGLDNTAKMTEFEFLMHVYHTYEEANENKDDPDFIANFREKEACLERYFHETYFMGLDKENEVKLQEINMMKDELIELDSNEAYDEQLHKEIEKMRQDLHELDRFQSLAAVAGQDARKEIESKEKEKILLEEELIQMKSEIDEHRALIARQEISAADAQRMRFAQQEIENKSKCCVEEMQNIEEQLKSAETSIARQHKIISDDWFKFVQDAKTLALRAQAYGITVPFDFDSISPFQPAFAEQCEKIQRGLQILRQCCISKVHQLELEVDENQKFMRALQDEKDGKFREQQKINNDLTATIARYENLEKTRRDEKVEAKLREEQLKKILEQLEQMGGMSCEEKAKEVERLRQEKTDLEKFVVDEETKMSEYLQKIIDCHTKRLNAIKATEGKIKDAQERFCQPIAAELLYESMMENFA